MYQWSDDPSYLLLDDAAVLADANIDQVAMPGGQGEEGGVLDLGRGQASRRKSKSNVSDSKYVLGRAC